MSNIVHIMRGPSGCGKSTYAASIINSNPTTTVIVSADRFFVDPDGDYMFDPAKLGKAHSWCLGLFLDAIHNNVETIVVDNTNVNTWEFQNYITIAANNGYDVIVHEWQPKTIEDVRICAFRNRHAVPAAVVYVMCADFVPLIQGQKEYQVFEHKIVTELKGDMP